MLISNGNSCDDELIRKRSERLFAPESDQSIGCNSFTYQSFSENPNPLKPADLCKGGKNGVGNGGVIVSYDHVKPPDSSKNISDEERNKYVARIMEFSLLKTKQLAARAFQEDLISKLPGVVERETLMQAGHLLDASARIYSFRVDATHTAVYEVRSQLGDDSKIKPSTVSSLDASSADADGENVDKNVTRHDNKKLEMPSDSDVESDKAFKKKKYTEYSSDDLPDASMSTTKDFRDLDLNSENFLLKYCKRKEANLKKCQLRRAKMSCIIHDISDLNAENSASCSDQLYGKATRNIDEGSCTGLLMLNALVTDEGQRILLHTRASLYRSFDEENVSEKEMSTLYDNLGNISDSSLNASRSSTSSPYKSFCNSSKSLSSLYSTVTNTRDYSSRSEAEIVKLLANKLNDLNFLNFLKWRFSAQKKYGLTGVEILSLVEEGLVSLKESEKSLLLSLLTPLPGKVELLALSTLPNKTNCLSGEGFPAINDIISMFEESFNWTVFRQSWDSHLDDSIIYSVSPKRKKNGDYNFFFARNTTNKMIVKNKENFLHCSLRHSVTEEKPEKSLKQLRQILEKIDINKIKSLFKAVNLEDLNETIVALSTSLSIHSSVSLQGLNVNHNTLGTISEEDDSTDYLVTKAAMVEEMQVGNNEKQPHSFSPIGMAYSVEENCDHQTSQVSDDTPTQVLILTKNVEQKELISKEAYDDPKRSTPITLTTAFTDDSHWAGRFEEKGTSKDGDKERQVTIEKKRRKKVQKEAPKELFSFDDTDDFPLDVLKRKLKSSHNLRVKEETVLCVKNSKSRESLFTPDMFEKLSFLRNDTDLFTEGSVLTQFLLEDWCKGGKSASSNKENDNIFVSRSPDFLSLFDGCFEEEADSASENEINEKEQNVCLGCGDDDLFATDIEELNTENADRIAQLFPGDKKREEVQGFFANCATRQRRINAQAVKRAISLVLSNKNLDANALRKEVEIAEASNSNNSKMDMEAPLLAEPNSSLILSRNSLSLSASETQLQLQEEEEIVEDPTREVHNVNASIDEIHIQGTHTFSSMLAHVPDFLAGRTAEDINPVDTFSIFLHLCNENNFEIIQRHGEDGLVLQSELDDFTIINSRSDRSCQKRRQCH